MEEQEKNVEKENSKKISQGIIISIVVAGIIIIFLIAVIIILVGKQKNTNKVTSNNVAQNNNKIDTISSLELKDNTIEELSKNAENEEKAFCSALENEMKELAEKTSTYEAYNNNKDKIEEFYNKIIANSKNFAIRIREYALKYAEVLINSGKSYSSIYDDLEDLYDDIYDGIASDFYDDIYDDLLGEMYDYYYDGVLSDAYDTVPYQEYSEARSREYKLYSGTRSDVYKVYSKSRSDVYSFYSKLRSKVYSENLEKAKKEVEDFKEEINELKLGITNTSSENNGSAISSNNSSSDNSDNDNKVESTPTITSNSESVESPISTSGLSTDFKAAMDAYEAFMDEYVSFMKNYQANSTDFTLIAQYATIVKKYSEQMATFEKWKTEDLTEEELAYYIDVQARVSKKMLEVTQ